MARAKPKKLVLIVWEDPVTHHAGWFDLDEKTLSKLEMAEVRSVGWVIKEDRKKITIASSIISDRGKDVEASCDVTVLKSQIIYREDIDVHFD